MADEIEEELRLEATPQTWQLIHLSRGTGMFWTMRVSPQLANVDIAKAF